jgi:hypothetical protein
MGTVGYSYTKLNIKKYSRSPFLVSFVLSTVQQVTLANMMKKIIYYGQGLAGDFFVFF